MMKKLVQTIALFLISINCTYEIAIDQTKGNNGINFGENRTSKMVAEGHFIKNNENLSNKPINFTFDMTID